MRIHVVSPSESGLFAEKLLKELEEIEKQGARIYRTHPVDDTSGQTCFVLSTTSKDVHLFFGILGSKGQFYLSRMLEEEFGLKKCSQLLLCLQRDTHIKRDALVTRTVEHAASNWKTVTLTFSPAH